MIVRHATTNDFPQIEILIEEFLNESLKDFGAKIEKQVVNKTMRELINNCLVLEDKNNKVIGLLAGKIIDESTSNSKIFQEVVWYVSKSYRKYGLLLLQKMEDWCKTNKIRAMVMVHIGNSMPDKLARFYKRMGYKHLECHYIRRL